MKRSNLVGCAILLASSAAVAQNPPSADLLQDGLKYFAEKCAACHGDDAGGSDMGPKLVATRRLRTRSVKQLRSLIEQGVPSTGMPAFHIDGHQLDALAAFVRSLNTSAAETPTPTPVRLAKNAIRSRSSSGLAFKGFMSDCFSSRTDAIWGPCSR